MRVSGQVISTYFAWIYLFFVALAGIKMQSAELNDSIVIQSASGYGRSRLTT